MMRFLAIFSFFTLITSAFAQETVEIVLKGQVIDTVQNLPLPDVKITIVCNFDSTYNVTSDSLGNYELIFIQPKGKVGIYLHPPRGEWSFFGERIDTVANSNLSLEKKINLQPAKICWDSFLPFPVMFDQNQSMLFGDTLDRLVYELGNVADGSSGAFDIRKLKISSYCAYDESERVANKRLRFIHDLVLKAGIKEENIIFENVGKKDLFVCEYCDGCHYAFLKGTGYVLSKSSFKELEEEQEKLEHNQTRRTVLFQWVNKD